MNIYTSYFANLKKLEKANIKPIAICLYKPKWYNGISYDILAPTKQILSLKDDVFGYTEQYNRYLGTLNPHKIVEDLNALSQGKDIALLCYEKPSDFCHRHLVSKWLCDNGYDVSEYSKNDTELTFF
jgi:uncharacterized protein YeaO (DUF488 family)